MRMNLSRLNRASFRGVPFLVDRVEVTAGTKTVLFEFPLTDYRLVKDLGAAGEIFKVSAIITGSRYIEQRDALIGALKQKGAGIFVSPFGGRHYVQTTDLYNLSEDIKELGVARFSMEFSVVSDKKFPYQATDNRSQINKFSQDVLDSAKAVTEEFYNVTQGFRENYQDAMDTLNNFVQAIDVITEPIQSTSEALADFTSTMNNFKDSISSSIARPSLLAANIDGVFSSAAGLGASSAGRFEYASSLFSYGSDFYYPPEITAARIERNLNRRLIAQQVNLSALANGYNEAVNIDFTDEDHLDRTIDMLDDQYYYVQQLDDITNDNIDAINALRNQCNMVFESVRVGLRNIINAYTPLTCITNLTYQYYGSLDDDEVLLDLNNILNPNEFSGNIKVLD